MAEEDLFAQIEVLDGGVFDELEVKNIIAQAVQAVRRLHETGYYHRYGLWDSIGFSFAFVFCFSFVFSLVLVLFVLFSPNSHPNSHPKRHQGGVLCGTFDG
jgi:hypothetical protein